MLRIAPGVEAHTHEYVQTGQEDTKFGFLWPPVRHWKQESEC